MQVGRDPTGFHTAGEPGSIPGPAIDNCCGWASAHPGLISLDSRCATPGPATYGRVRKQAKRSPTNASVGARSVAILQVRLLPRSLDDPVLQRRRRLVDIQESAGSIPAGITHWSVGVAAARRRGKAEDRVRAPDGPLETRAARSTVGRLVCTQAIGVRLLGGPLVSMGSWSKGKTRPGVAEIPVQLWVGPLK